MFSVQAAINFHFGEKDIMRISENIRTLTENRTAWRLYRNRCYSVLLQRADPERVYNVQGRPGIVYNYLEDAFEPVGEGQYIATGLLGEMWTLPAAALGKYRIDPMLLTDTPQKTETVETDTVYTGLRIPAQIPFTLVVHYGAEALLHGNRSGVPHGDGDMILLPAVRDAEGEWIPDPADSGRIVNGSIFDRLYRPYAE